MQTESMQNMDRIGIQIPVSRMSQRNRNQDDPGSNTETAWALVIM
jgi:hypothetical protein